MTPVAPPQKSRTGMIIVIVVVVLCLCCLVAAGIAWSFGDTLMNIVTNTIGGY